MTEKEEKQIRIWLESLGEAPEAIERDLDIARRHLDTAQWLLARASAA